MEVYVIVQGQTGNVYLVYLYCLGKIIYMHANKKLSSFIMGLINIDK